MELLAERQNVMLVGEESFADSLRTGDVRAIGLLYDQYHGLLRNLAFRLIGHAETADDLVHDVFVDLPNALKRFRFDSLVSTFLCGMLVRKSHKYIRAAMRARRAMSRVANEYNGLAECPESRVVQQTLAEAIDRALDMLHPNQRIAFVLCEVEERTSLEVALMLRVRPGTVRARLHHAKRKLRTVLEGEGWR